MDQVTSQTEPDMSAAVPLYQACDEIYFRGEPVETVTVENAKWIICQGRDLAKGRDVDVALPMPESRYELWQALKNGLIVKLPINGREFDVKLYVSYHYQDVKALVCTDVIECPTEPFVGRFIALENDGKVTRHLLSLDETKFVTITGFEPSPFLRRKNKSEGLYDLMEGSRHIKGCKTGDLLRLSVHDVQGTLYPARGNLQQMAREPEDMIIAPTRLAFEETYNAMTLHGTIAGNTKLRGREIVIPVRDAAEVATIRDLYRQYEKTLATPKLRGLGWQQQPTTVVPDYGNTRLALKGLQEQRVAAFEKKRRAQQATAKEHKEKINFVSSFRLVARDAVIADWVPKPGNFQYIRSLSVAEFGLAQS